MKKLLALTAILVFSFILSGCSSVQMRKGYTNDLTSKMEGWVGHSASQLVSSALGYPSALRKDGKGGKIYIYVFQDRDKVSATTSYEIFEGYTTNYETKKGTKVYTRKFYVNSNGIIYAWEFLGAAYGRVIPIDTHKLQIDKLENIVLEVQ